jgi:sodium/proline symporter
MEVYEKLSHPAAWIIFASTLILPVWVGFLTMRRMKSQSDFFIGGRVMDKITVALSAVASGRSSWLVLGVSGMAYTMGLSAVWSVVGYILVEMIQFVTIGRRLRIEAGRHDSITLLDYFESRFRDDKQTIRWTGALIIGIFLTAYVAAQFNAGAKALSTAVGMPFPASLAVSAALTLFYMVLGGFVAVSYNDVVRAVIMILGLVILPVTGLFKMGGAAALMKVLQGLNPAFVDPFSLGTGALIGFLGIGLGSPGQPHIIVRYMSIRDPDQLKLAALVGTFWNVVLAWGALCIGLIGRAMIPDPGALPQSDPEMIYLVLSARFFGPVLYGLMVGGIFAAILSTVDSQLLVVASTWVRDFYEKIINRGRRIDEGKKLRLSRTVLVLSGILSVVLALAAKDLIFWLVLFAWGGLGASIGTSLIFSLYWRKTHPLGVTTGMISGTLITILWKLFLKGSTGVYELIPGFAGAALMIWLTSLLFNRKSTAAKRR